MEVPTAPTPYLEEQLVPIAIVCHEANRAYCQTLGDMSQVPWPHAAMWQQESAIDGVRRALERHSLSHLSDGEQSHNGWMEQKLRQGWTWGPIKDPVAKQHPCLLPYAALPSEERRKDVLFLAICRALDPARTT